MPGTVEARCDDAHGTREILKTAKRPAAILLSADTATAGMGFDEVAFVRAGTPVPSANLPLDFDIQGPGAFLASDNADNAYTAPFSSPHRETLNGRAIALLRATSLTGVLHLKATSLGLRSGTLSLPISSR